MATEQKGRRGAKAPAPEAPEAGEGGAASVESSAGETVTGDGSGEALQPIEGGDSAAMAPALAGGPAAPESREEGGESEDHISAFDRQMNRLVDIALDAEFESGSLRGDIRDTMLDIIKSRPKPWSQLSEMEQRDIAKALDTVSAVIVKKLVFVLAEQDDISVHATLKGYSVDGETFKLKLTARGDEDTAVQLFKLDGHEVVLISADSKRFQGARGDTRIDPDQPAFGFADQEIRSTPPGDDSDLNPDDDLPTEPATRINLKSGMLESLAQGGDPDNDSDWEDMRAATPEELAVAREAQADFDDDEQEDE